MPLAPAFMANGDINPSRFVKIDASATSPGFKVIVATGLTDRPVGISQVGTYDPPGVNGSSGLAASAGKPIQVYGDGEVCLLKAGGTIAPGDFLGSDGTGQGVKVLFTGSGGPIYVGAQALEAANSGELVRVVIRIYATDNTA